MMLRLHAAGVMAGAGVVLGLLAACGSSVAPAGGAGSGTGSGSGPAGSNGVSWDRSCDLAPYPSALWTRCEAQNYAKTLQAPQEELQNPAFLQRFLAQGQANAQAFLARDAADPSWVLAGSPALAPIEAAAGDPAALSAAFQQGLQALLADPQQAVSLSVNTPLTPVCAADSSVCVGDPFRWPQAHGPDGDAFYASEALVTPVVFYDSGCARLSGHLWQPRNTGAGQTLPGVVITNGSIQAPEPQYWWAAQALVRAGYVVLSYDPRGQGQSDFTTPAGLPGSNAMAAVFWTNQVDAIDFFHSTPGRPYPNQAACAGTYPTVTAAYNPAYAVLDSSRLGIAGHSLGAIAVSVVQGYGAPGADPWPGKIDRSNPVGAAVAWDSLITPAAEGFVPVSNAPLPPQLAALITQIAAAEGTLPKFGPRVPALSFSADYGLLSQFPYVAPPDPDAQKFAFRLWEAAGVPVYELAFQGTTHLDFALTAGLTATSWCADTSGGACRGGYASPAIAYYTVAWFDRWLKKPGEPGYDDADARLLDDGGANGAVKMSFHYRSARDYPDRQGVRRHCEDLRAGC
jgi:hypothetical protein